MVLEREIIRIRRSKGQRAGSGLGLLFRALCPLMILLAGCVTAPSKGKTFATVNGEKITEDEVTYALNIAHRREDLSSTKVLNIEGYVQKLIDDRLIMQEARRMGIEQSQEIQQALQAFLLRESVVRLHDDEIVKKVSVSEKEIAENYKKDYEQFTLGLFSVKTEGDAQKAVEELKNGADFKELAKKYELDEQKKDGNNETTVERRTLPPQTGETIAKLKTGEFTTVKMGNKYLVLKLLDRKEAPAEGLEKASEAIERALRKSKESARSEEYLKYLRDHAPIKIHREALAAVKLNGTSEEIEKRSKDTTPVAEVFGNVMTAGDLVSMAAQQKNMTNETASDEAKAKQKLIDNWLDFKVVDHEALSRHYEKNLEVRETVNNYKDQLLKNSFVKQVILPKIMVSAKILQDYYSSHTKDFLKPVRYKIQRITLKTKEEADEVLKNLKDGADFSWLAKRKSVDSARESGGEVGWITKDELPEPAKSALDKLKAGEMSPVVEVSSMYMIMRLQDKVEGEVENFDNIKSAVYKAYVEAQFNEIFDSYVAQLKKDAEISIDEDTVKEFQKRFQR